MEDPSLEWKVEESSPSGGSSKVSWILNKGLGLGKKVVITGIVISSAPLVLPPLVVFSVLGFVFSLPFGLYFASYACTEKLMSKLLSTPTSPPLMLEDWTDEEESSGNGEEDEDVAFGEGIDMEEEEEEKMEDTKEGIEMRIELLDMGNEGLEKGKVLAEDYYGQGGVEMDKQEAPLEDVDDIVMEEGYKEDDEYLVAEEKEQPLEERRDEEIPKGYDEKKELRYAENNGTIPKVVKPIEEIGDELTRNIDEKHVGSIVEVEIPVGEMSEGINVGSIVEEEQKPVADKKAVLEGGKAEVKIFNDVDEVFQLNRERKTVIFSNADAIEIADESGFDLFDEQDAGGEQYSFALHSTPEENNQSSSYVSNGSAAFVEHPVSVGLPVSAAPVPRSSSDKYITVASNKALYGEEKVWEQIDALRTIVGYKVTPQATCIEELKALYIFTGVEPPVSFRNPSDYVEVNDKLRFLMSIVGVK